MEFVLRGHTAPVYLVAFSPDGQLLATASSDGSARVWEVATGRETARMKRNEGGVTFSRDGSRIATGYLGDARVWDARSGTQVLAIRGSGDEIESGRVIQNKGLSGVAFSPTEDRLATLTLEGTARIWDARVANDPPGIVTWLVPPLRHVRGYDPWAEDDACRRARTVDLHADAAEAAAKRGDGFAQAFHLRCLDAIMVRGATERFRRGLCRLRLGRKWEGLADLAHPDLLDARKAERLEWHALACLAVGDRSGYHSACVRRLNTDKPTYDDRNFVWTCCVAPDAGVDAALLVEMAERFNGMEAYDVQDRYIGPHPTRNSFPLPRETVPELLRLAPPKSASTTTKTTSNSVFGRRFNS
jgi:hypothetical protein